MLCSIGTGLSDSYDMASGGFDADLLAFLQWSKTLKGLSANTIRVRLDLLQRLHVFLGFPLRDVEPGHLLRFEKIAIAGRAAESRRSYVGHIRAFYRWALATGIVSADPSTMLTIPVVPQHLPRPIAEEDLARALDAARPKMRAILVLAAFAGLRAIEISGLLFEDIHREPDGTAYIHVRKGKGNKSRNVEIGQRVIQALQAYGFRRRGYVFLGHDGQPQEPPSISSSANRFLRSQDVDATLHQLRHRYATQMYQVSRDLRMVQIQLGHSSPATTQVYTRPSQDSASRAVRALDDLPLPRAPQNYPTPLPS